ncbi:MAG: hypothetical protein WC822_05735, partial [Candidatus Paceibacterota bacterium]
MIIFIIALVLFLLLLPFVGWYALIAVGIVLLIGWGIWLSVPDCPRMIMGYNCKGEGCDHSEESIMAAKVAI